MTLSEKEATLRIVAHIRALQSQIRQPDNTDATDEEITTVINLFWEWGPKPHYPLPSRSGIARLVAILRGCKEGHAYVSAEHLARFIRANASRIHAPLSIILKKRHENLTDEQFYQVCRWNYRPTSLVRLLLNNRRDLYCQS